MHERQEIRLFIEEKETVTYPVVLGWRIETVEDLSLDNFTKKLNERFMNKVNGIMIISALRKAYSEKKFIEFYQKLNGI